MGLTLCHLLLVDRQLRHGERKPTNATRVKWPRIVKKREALSTGVALAMEQARNGINWENKEN